MNNVHVNGYIFICQVVYPIKLRGEIFLFFDFDRTRLPNISAIIIKFITYNDFFLKNA